MKTFEIGKTYITKSPCYHNCTWTFTVAKRTTCTVTITDGEKTKRCRIIKGLSEENGAEAIFPLGQYSMAPILRADSVVEEVKEENEEIAETDNVIAFPATTKEDVETVTLTYTKEEAELVALAVELVRSRWLLQAMDERGEACMEMIEKYKRVSEITRNQINAV